MTPAGLGAALDREQWELAALYLLVGMARVLETAPDALPAVLDLISETDTARDDGHAVQARPMVGDKPPHETGPRTGDGDASES